MIIYNYLNSLISAFNKLKTTLKNQGVTVEDSDRLNALVQKVENIKGDGYEEGRQAEYNDFWDAYQDFGNRTDYRNAFFGPGWNNKTFKPKYPIVPVGEANYMFDSATFDSFDFPGKDITLNLRNATSLTFMFRQVKGLKRLGTFDCSNCVKLDRPFYACGIQTIDNFIVHENLSYVNPFHAAGNLVNLTVSGVIGKSGLSLTSCTKLSKASITSVVNALSSTTSGLSVTLSLTAVNNAFTADEWDALIATKPNCTISLA